VSVLRALLTQVDGWDQQARILTFFHENQFAYPQRNPKQNDFQFTAINFNTALASDKIGFNSNYNLFSFLAGCRKFLQSASDMKIEELVDDLEQKSTLLYPGIDFIKCDKIESVRNRETPVIVWNHRWEHDKNPDQFFETLLKLEAKGRDFHLILLGQSFQSCPKCFLTARQHFGRKILHYGFAESYSQYISLLKQGDIVVSTALHEFYGIAIIEAVRSGCFPVLPEKLSYPELFDSQYLYGENGLVKKLDALLQKDDVRLSDEESRKLTDKFSWLSLCNQYHDWLFTS
jgi:glycosyltransferase involved in cell wall biosynthesis